MTPLLHFTSHLTPSPPPRSGAASCVLHNRLYLFGGYGGSSRLDDFFYFDLEREEWVTVKQEGSPGARENNGVIIKDTVGNRLFIFAG